MEILEHHERAEQTAHSSGHEAVHGGSFNKRVALLIICLAAALAVTEMGGKSSQNDYTARNIEAANLWAFFQAKTIRMTVTRTAAEMLEVLPPGEAGAAIQKKLEKFNAAAQRYDSEPETGEGRKELAARAKEAEVKRDKALAAYHHFEYGSAAFQLAIVLASAAVISGVGVLAFVSGGIGAVGAALALIGWFAPTLLHL